MIGIAGAGAFGTALAVALARDGLRINKLQRFINEILQPIIDASPEATALATPMFGRGRLAEVGEYIFNPDLADTFEALARQGPRWFYEGEPAQQLVSDCARRGGLVSAADLKSYDELMKQSRRARTTSTIMVATGPVVAVGAPHPLARGVLHLHPGFCL